MYFKINLSTVRENLSLSSSILKDLDSYNTIAYQNVYNSDNCWNDSARSYALEIMKSNALLNIEYADYIKSIIYETTNLLDQINGKCSKIIRGSVNSITFNNANYNNIIRYINSVKSYANTNLTNLKSAYNKVKDANIKSKINSEITKNNNLVNMLSNCSSALSTFNTDIQNVLSNSKSKVKKINKVNYKPQLLAISNITGLKNTSNVKNNFSGGGNSRWD